MALTLRVVRVHGQGADQEAKPGHRSSTHGRGVAPDLFDAAAAERWWKRSSTWCRQHRRAPLIEVLTTRPLPLRP